MDDIIRGETWKFASTLYSSYSLQTSIGIPFDLTGCTITGFVALDFVTAIQYPLTVLIDAIPTTGKYIFSLSAAQILALPYPEIYKLRLILTMPSGDIEFISETSTKALTVRVRS